MIVDIDWKNAITSGVVQADRWIGKMGAFRVDLIYNSHFRYMTLELGEFATSIGLPRLRGRASTDRILKMAEARIGRVLQRLKTNMGTLRIGERAAMPVVAPDPDVVYIRLWEGWGEFDRTVKSTKEEYQLLIAPAMNAGNPIDSATVDGDILDNMLNRRHQKALPPRAIIHEIQMV